VVRRRPNGNALGLDPGPTASEGLRAARARSLFRPVCLGERPKVPSRAGGRARRRRGPIRAATDWERCHHGGGSDGPLRAYHTAPRASPAHPSPRADRVPRVRLGARDGLGSHRHSGNTAVGGEPWTTSSWAPARRTPSWASIAVEPLPWPRTPARSSHHRFRPV
jgi:hypothetical protein